jgi:hypothetical protein
VVPDLENIAAAYLQSVRDAAVPPEHHEWMIVELIDQMVRREGGGEMHRKLLKANGDLREFVVGRIGMEAERVFASSSRQPPRRFSPATVAHYIRRLQQECAGALAALVMGVEGRAALKEGLFRRSGQVHQWMYDRISLKKLLDEAGFVDAKACRADESWISHFTSFDLDTLDGRVRKPDSLFMEAVRP